MFFTSLVNDSLFDKIPYVGDSQPTQRLSWLPFVLEKVLLFDIKSDDSTTKAQNRHRRCRLTDVDDIDLSTSTMSIQRL